MTGYVIEVRNRFYRFATLDAARWAANDLFTRSGIVAGIVADKCPFRVSYPNGADCRLPRHHGDCKA